MRRLCTPAWLVRHLAAAGLVAGFLALGWWQLGRAAAGNALSWAYAVQWPVFAAFVGFIWWREARLATGGGRDGSGTAAEVTDRMGASEEPAVRRPVRTRRPPPPTEDADPALAAYNRYLAWLNAHPGARPGDYPG